MNSASIQILDDVTAKQIAAGEVIERPSCVARELIDNAVDAGAARIEIDLKHGGLEGMRVSDDGGGMSREDLALCCKSHATSKIRSAGDLLRVTSMGFRGEALASISAISRVAITSFDAGRGAAFRIAVEGGTESDVASAAHGKGTTVDVEKLFFSIPARKKFLASERAERSRLKATVLQKAAAFPRVAFTLKEGSETLLHLPAETAFARAVRLALNADARMFVWHENAEKDSTANTADAKTTRAPMKLHAALGLPEIATTTRRHMHAYINGRPVRAFQLTQALEYAYKDMLHGHLFPQAVLFFEIDPAELDVNIHPAKQEVRIKSIDRARALIMQAVRNSLARYATAAPSLGAGAQKFNGQFYAGGLYDTPRQGPKQEQAQEQKQARGPQAPYSTPYSTRRHAENYSGAYSGSYTSDHPLFAAFEKSPEYFAAPPQSRPHAAEKFTETFLGCAFETYAVFETQLPEGAALLFLDFHAAHERQLFDELTQNPQPQPLLLPAPVDIPLADDAAELLIRRCEAIGIVIEQGSPAGQREYAISALPRALHGNPRLVIGLLENPETQGGHENIDAAVLARAACRAAVKAHDHIDEKNARALLAYTQSLETPRCPHGRPLLCIISKKTIDTMSGRQPGRSL